MGVADTKKGTAQEAHVLSGYTLTSAKGVNKEGTIPNNGALNYSAVNAAASVSPGYYSGGEIDTRPSYARGVADADGRQNPNSTNYKSGYNSGYSDGHAAGVRSCVLKKVKIGTTDAGSRPTEGSSDGITRTFDVRQIPELARIWQSLTADNFVIRNQYFHVGTKWDYSGCNINFGHTASVSYANGIVTVTQPKDYYAESWGSGADVGWRKKDIYGTCDVYAYYVGTEG